NNIIDRYETVYATEFIDDESDMAPALAHFQKQIERRHAWRHNGYFRNHFLNLNMFTARKGTNHILDMNGANYIIQGTFINRNAAKLTFCQQFEQFILR